MTVITTRITVALDGAVSIADTLPPGEHVAAVTLAATPPGEHIAAGTAAKPPGWPGKPFTMENFPIHDGPWDNSISLRREDIYGDDGR